MTSHIDNARTETTDQKGEVDTVDTEIARVIAAEKTQSYRDVWRTHKKGLLWSVGVSWVCRIHVEPGSHPECANQPRSS